LILKGRPTIFKNDELIIRAQELFWEKGYTATSLSELLKITGAGSGSFYNTFKGGKKEIFSKSIQQRRDAFELFKAEISECESPLDLIKTFFRSVATEDNKAHRRGCIIANTIVEMSNLEEELENEAIQILKEVELMFSKAVKHAQDKGLISNPKEPHVLGRYLVTFWCGLNTLRRMYPDSQTLLQQIEMQLEVIT
jgi:TetR/AcrR family transcriptional repressor of nem operon